ncbi:MAG: energy transducer TonB [Prevotellaceae bacterium]|jgi:protein TonB|nr:energy transducer TonB [Prevotellaceae bacterium]
MKIKSLFFFILFLFLEINLFAQQDSAVAKQSDDVLLITEIMPEFPGGQAELFKFISRNLKYPSVARESDIQGRVVVNFVVRPSGKITDIKVVRGVHPALDAEAVRVIGLLPDWIPGTQNGKAVAVSYNLPIVFRLSGDAPQKTKNKSK